MKTRFNNLVTVSAVLSLLLIITGCATFEGAINLDKMPAETTWLSPANKDGIKDSLYVEFSMPAYKDLSISRYEIIIDNSSGGTVFRQGEIAGRNKLPGLKLPDHFEWNGVDLNGKYLPDGEYFYRLEVDYGTKQNYVSPVFKAIVDNTAPSIEVSAAYPLFSPDGDGRLDTLRIFQRFSSVEESWKGTVKDSSGKAVKTYSWAEMATDFEWDGRNENGTYVPDGEYSYLAESTDMAGNSAGFGISSITVNTNRAAVSITRNLDSFSPNGDGKKDSLNLSPGAENRSGISSWIISVYDRKNSAVRNFRGADSLPASVSFDGKDDSGRKLPDGFYKGYISISYKNGTVQENVSQLFEIDTTAPLVYLSSAYLLFSPDGDGRKDTIKINQSSSQEPLWKGAITDASGNEIRNYSWKDRAVQFEWDGLNSRGEKVPDGLYNYRIESSDGADNNSVRELKGIKIDTRVPVAKLNLMNASASPDGDGINDFISFVLSTDITENIESWNLAILDRAGNEIKSFTTDSAAAEVPVRIDWDGSNMDGVVKEDEYTARLSIDYMKGNLVSAVSEKNFRIDISGPEAAVSVAPVPFSPDGDGVDEILTIKASAKDVSGIGKWEIRILDPAGNTFKTFSGNGEMKSPLTWNGLSDSRELVQSASVYTVQYRVSDSMGNTTTASTDASIDILVLKDGANLKIIISSIYFVPNTADYLSLGAEERKRNLATLDRLAEILKKYSQYRIRLEGHTARVYWDNPKKLQTEQEEVLLPLSTERAEVIKKALVDRGINPERLSTIGYGGDHPVVPHSDIANRWKNRRVEFVLIKNN